jgi:hypothetical protein
MLTSWNAFDRLMFSNGEIAPPDRIMELHNQAWRSLVMALDDILQRKSSLLGNRCGIVCPDGFAPAAGAGALQVNVGVGWGFSQDAPPHTTIYPVVLDAVTTVTCETNAGIPNPRYDLIVVESDYALADYTTRMVRDSGGVIAPQTLPQREDYKAKVSVLKGIAAPAPACPTPGTGQIALAACYLPAGFAGVFGTGGSAVRDVRTFLASRLGGSRDVIARYVGPGPGGGNPYALQTIVRLDPTIKLITTLCDSAAVGHDSISIAVPRELNEYGVSPMISMGSPTGVATPYGCTAGVSAIAPWWGGAATTYQIDIFTYLLNAGGAPVDLAPGDEGNLRVSVLA